TLKEELDYFQVESPAAFKSRPASPSARSRAFRLPDTRGSRAPGRTVPTVPAPSLRPRADKRQENISAQNCTRLFIIAYRHTRLHVPKRASWYPVPAGAARIRSRPGGWSNAVEQ